MKEIKAFIIADVIVLLLKVVCGFLLHSYTMLASGVIEVLLIVGTLLLSKKIEGNKKSRGILTALFGALIVFSSLVVLFFAFTTKLRKTSLLIILPVLVCLISRYVVSSFYTNSGYQRKKGLLSIGSMISNMDFANYIVIIVAMILMKISKWVGVLKYSDRVGAVLISLFVIYKAYNLIRHSFANLKDNKKEVPNEYLEEIKKRKEVKTLENMDVNLYGGFVGINCSLQIAEGIGPVDLNSFVITLQDYLLKIADIVRITLVEKKEEKKPKKVRVRSKKQDARNSRSGNGKKGSKGKNNKQKNKKS